MTDSAINKIGKFLLWSTGGVLLIYLLYFFIDILIILALSILLSFIFDPLISFLEKKGINRLFSTLSIFAAAGIFIYLGFAFLLPKLIIQMNALLITFQQIDIYEQIKIVEAELVRYLPFLEPEVVAKRIESFFETLFTDTFSKVGQVLTSIVSVVAIIVIVPFITFFILKDNRKILKGLLNIMPNKYFEMSYWIIKKVSFQLGRFVRGWILDAAFVGILCGVGFYAIGIQNALPLGMIAGVGHLIPYLGPLIGAVPAIIISVIQFGNLSMLPAIVLLVMIVYALDNGFFQPYVFSKSVDMHPIIIILLIITGSQIIGVLGMLFAVPTATVIKTAAKEIYFAMKNYRIAKT